MMQKKFSSNDVKAFPVLQESDDVSFKPSIDVLFQRLTIAMT